MENHFTCVLIHVKRLKLELDISGGFMSIYIPLYFQGKFPNSAKVSVCLCALTTFLETGMKLSFGYHSGAPHRYSGNNLGFKFNLSSCFVFNQPLKAKKKLLMNISSILWVQGHIWDGFDMGEFKCCIKLWCSTNVFMNNLQIVERVQEGKMAWGADIFYGSKL